MRAWRKWAAALLTAALCLSCAGCAFLPSEDYNDYDVSGYIQALLDSSYRDSHQGFIAITQVEEESARANHVTTVENAAVNFCNHYNLYPDDTQMERLESIMAQTLMNAQYDVKDEVKTETGYNIEVAVTPIISFSGLSGELSSLQSQARDEASRLNTPAVSSSEEDGGEDWGDEGWGDEYGEEEAEPTPEPTPAPQVDAQELYMEKVLELCQNKAASPQYSSEGTSIVMDIRLTENGELQLDLNQIDQIDRTVLLIQ